MTDKRNFWEKLKDKIKGNKYVEKTIVNELDEKIGTEVGKIDRQGNRIGIWERRTFEDFEELIITDYENHTITKPSVYNKGSKIVKEYKMSDKEFQDYGRFRFVPKNYEEIEKVYEDNSLVNKKVTNCKNGNYTITTKEYSKKGELEKETQEIGSAETGYKTKVRDYKAEKETKEKLKRIAERNFTGTRTEECKLGLLDQLELGDRLPKTMYGDYVFGRKIGFWKTENNDKLEYINDKLVSATFNLGTAILRGEYDVDGIRKGTWVKEGLNTRERHETDYEKGEVKEYRDYNSEGELERVSNFETGFQVTSFYKDNKKVKELDMGEGICREFYPSGELRSEETLDSYKSSDSTKKDKKFYYKSGNVEKIIKGLRETEFLDMEGQHLYKKKIKNREENKAITSYPKKIKEEKKRGTRARTKSKGKER